MDADALQRGRAGWWTSAGSSQPFKERLLQAPAAGNHAVAWAQATEG